ncbi:MAG TPA: hypothetical protein VD838_01770, partial [Anaeromyxobacteraceae bacterium]|nr:hypothetical protein [Anaeromyxobacteraceae bacterium]
MTAEEKARWARTVGLLDVLNELQVAAVVEEAGKGCEVILVHHCPKTPKKKLAALPDTWDGRRVVLRPATMQDRTKAQRRNR